MRGARRDVLFVNEANNVDWESYYQLSIRTREFIYIDFNPVNEFWAHTELVGRNNVDYVILTYKDNEALEQSIINEFKEAEEKAKTSDYWRNWVDVYVYGKIGNLQGSIFNNWRQCDYIPDEAQLKGYGLDFGYTNDPSALTAIYYMDGAYYLDEVIYEKGLTNADINNKMKSLGVDKSIHIYADSAEPKSIKELKLYGWRVVDAIKGRDSINFGIQEMQKETFYITKKSLNLVNEFRKYMWKVDKEGKAINQPIDAFNHGIDGIRYYFQSKNKQPRRYYAGS
jgi:phage terminase large subunit